MNKKLVKVAISGAAGQIGYSLLFRIASGQMFGPETDVELRLLELEPALPALHGVAMELEDCAFPLLRNIVCTSDLKVGFTGANWTILVGAVPRKEGMERSDLLQVNGKIFSPQGKLINDNAADDVRVLVVGNPCNTNCLIAMLHAPRIPQNRFYAMTKLDENRARFQLAHKAKVSIDKIHNMAIWGNHSTTQYPDFYNANINGKAVTQVIRDELWLQTEFIPIVQKRGAEVIKARGASSAASAANAIIDTVHDITHDTPSDDFFSLAVCSQGEYGVDEGLVFSFPCRVERGQLKVVPGIVHNSFAQVKLQATLTELRAERDAVAQLGFLK